MMEAFVRAGGTYRFDLGAKAAHGGQQPVTIERVPEGACYVADGLHRVVSIFVGRKPPVLQDEEYRIKHVTYGMYLDIDLDGGWFTPFDPRTEVRLADLSVFKRNVRELISAGQDPASYIYSHRELYCRARTPDDTISGLAARWAHDGDM